MQGDVSSLTVILLLMTQPPVWYIFGRSCAASSFTGVWGALCVVTVIAHQLNLFKPMTTMLNADRIFKPLEHGEPLQLNMLGHATIDGRDAFFP